MRLIKDLSESSVFRRIKTGEGRLFFGRAVSGRRFSGASVICAYFIRFRTAFTPDKQKKVF